MKSRAKLDFEFSLSGILTLLGGYILLASIRIGFGSMKEPEAGFFPFVAGCIILITSALGLFPRSRGAEAQPIFRSGRELMTLLSVTVLSILWIIAMPVVGYAVMTFVVAFLYSKTMRLEGWWKPFLLSLGIGFFIYALFDLWLYIDLPRGILD
jgi:sterol desaturase/sphingolipid hydroxylase (fatty acid hydroxylase superfamily)